MTLLKIVRSHYSKTFYIKLFMLKIHCMDTLVLSQRRGLKRRSTIIKHVFLYLVFLSIFLSLKIGAFIKRTPLRLSHVVKIFRIYIVRRTCLSFLRKSLYHKIYENLPVKCRLLIEEREKKKEIN